MSRDDFKRFEAPDARYRNSKGKVRPAPQLPAGVPFADTHCHLGMLPAPGLVIARAAHRGFRLLVCILDPGELQPAEGELAAAECLAAADGWLADARDVLAGWGEADTPLPCLRFAVGVHPHNARNYDAVSEQLLTLLHDPRVSCLGEIGLDYHYDLSPRPVQREVFARQLQLAQRAGLPVQLHLREAHADALEILRREGVPQAGCVLHCFNLDAATVEPFVRLGCHIAFGGPLTFRKSWYTRVAALHVPLGRLLTETDAPYMAPEPLRGTECTPDMTLFTLRMLLDCFGYAGVEAATAALQPRAVDIENGAQPPQQDGIDFEALQQGLDEAGFCQRVYANAATLLDRPPTPWQLA